MSNEKIKGAFGSPVFLISAIILIAATCLSFPYIDNAPFLLYTEFIGLFTGALYIVLFASAKKGAPALGFMKIAARIMLVATLVVAALFVLIMSGAFACGTGLTCLNVCWGAMTSDVQNNPFPDDVFPAMWEIVVIFVCITAALIVLALVPQRKLAKNAKALQNGEAAADALKNTGRMLIIAGVLVSAMNFYFMADLINSNIGFETADIVLSMTFCGAGALGYALPGVKLAVN